MCYLTSSFPLLLPKSRVSLFLTWIIARALPYWIACLWFLPHDAPASSSAQCYFSKHRHCFKFFSALLSLSDQIEILSTMQLIFFFTFHQVPLLLSPTAQVLLKHTMYFSSPCACKNFSLCLNISSTSSYLSNLYLSFKHQLKWHVSKSSPSYLRSLRKMTDKW